VIILEKKIFKKRKSEQEILSHAERTILLRYLKISLDTDLKINFVGLSN